MKPITLLLAAGSLLLSAQGLSAQTDASGKKEYWNANTLLIPYRLPPAPAGYKPTYIDLDGDGDPDILRTVTANGIPVQWIDDDDDMQYGDLEGDTDNDCLMIDRNKDGVYGGYGDLIIDWVGEDEDGNPAMQVVVDNIPEANRMKTGNGHYMWVVDTDKDDVFNYIDWNTFTLRCWIHNGLSDFYEDYNGKSTFMKIHSTTERVNDVRMNWENPFLFYDPDNDGLTEMAIRFCDSPKIVKENGQAVIRGRDVRICPDMRVVKDDVFGPVYGILQEDGTLLTNAAGFAHTVGLLAFQAGLNFAAGIQIDRSLLGAGSRIWPEENTQGAVEIRGWEDHVIWLDQFGGVHTDMQDGRRWKEFIGAHAVEICQKGYLIAWKNQICLVSFGSEEGRAQSAVVLAEAEGDITEIAASDRLLAYRSDADQEIRLLSLES